MTKKQQARITRYKRLLAQAEFNEQAGGPESGRRDKVDRLRIKLAAAEQIAKAAV